MKLTPDGKQTECEAPRPAIGTLRENIRHKTGLLSFSSVRV